MNMDDFKTLLVKACSVLSENIPAEKYPYGVYFDIPGTKNGGQIRVELNRGNPKEYYLQTMSIRNGTDRAISNYLFSAPIETIKSKLLTDECHQEIQDSLIKLSDKVDDYYD